ncbi:hypothetical protein SLW70_11040 [Flavobacterium sp. NG2]|uniref:hypothetical protein n=1 Tax=Flavobacterium sp. NG2 TaxID=3097547 RepID=UPI002A8261ED|nr:hypothetical protein [Flavobacterium sp. NG2]WPR70478.1 hypothetical protein SLW70_11040 [Flavobacterium sp. NG2]
MNIKLKQFMMLIILVFVSNEINAGTIITSSTVINQTVLNSYSWPVTINGGTVGAPLVITLEEDVILSNSQNYFILNGNYINFNGNDHKITISGVNFYSGLIKNGSYNSAWIEDPLDPFNYISQITIVNGFSNIKVYNLTVNSINSDVASGNGWIGQYAFSINATNGLFENCSANGALRQGSGGIVGGRTSVTVKNSSFFGNHIGGYAGGIFGETSSGTAINCYSVAPSLGNRGGGIFGGDSSNATATNCYSYSTIVNNSGGIFGGYSSNCNASNCYSLGTIGSNAGGVYGGNSSGGTATNCYSANGNWNDATANSILTGTNGTVWNTITSPYKLISFATLISTDTTIDQSWINNHINNLPILLDTNVTITIAENLTFNDANMYFAVRGTGVRIDGASKTITLDNITNYRGVVNNGNYLGANVSAFTGSVVEKLGVISNSTTLKSYCGWIGQQGYGNGAGFAISNCYSTGEMFNEGTGGILGNAFMNGTVSNCYSLGKISGQSAAGIAATYNSEANRIYNCYANGSITGINASGICEPDMMMGGAQFLNCYVSNGVFTTVDANNNLIGTDGTIWNTSVSPYTLSVFMVLKWGVTSNGQKTQVNSIQVNKNGKKGDPNPITENGKIN